MRKLGESAQKEFIIDLSKPPEEIQKPRENSQRNIRKLGSQESISMMITKRKPEKQIFGILSMILRWEAKIGTAMEIRYRK